MPDDLTQPLAAFTMASSLALLLFLLLTGRKDRLETRLRQLSNRGEGLSEDMMDTLTRGALPRMGQALAPTKQEERSRLQTRLIQAGLYQREVMYVYLGVKLVLMIAPVLLGFLVALTGFLPTTWALLLGVMFGVFGMILPSFWLDRRKAARQTMLRRALPDALDVLVICLEGGLSLVSAFRRVAGELTTAHPLLAMEMRIVEREVQMGRTTAEAMRQFGERADLEELRNLGSIIGQSERFGASMVKALRVHADTLREKRLQYAEEMAQKAAIKILFPTLLCIFPCVFIVVLGPAFIQVRQLLAEMGP